jgi:tRNA 5-methylaminomethyl-2-thiouridine biosynthesis bifunctional protein
MSALEPLTPFHILNDHECLALKLSELGDGTAVFALWRRWQQQRPANHSRLHLVIHSAQLTPSTTLNTDPLYADLRALLLAQYPPALDGVHRLIFAAQRLTIDLWIGANDVPETTRPTTMPTPTFAVIGAGIAGLSMACALTQRGYPVTLIEQDAPLSGGSGNPRALLLSKLPKLGRAAHNLQTVGGLSSARWWGAWADNVVTATGALLLPSEDDLANSAGYPADMVELLDPEAIQARVGMESASTQLYLPRAAVIDPAALRDHVLASPLVTCITVHVVQLAQFESDWQLIDAHGQCIAAASQVIVASAKDSPRLCPTLPPLTVIRGQMSWCADAGTVPRMALGYGGYAVKFDGTLLLGSSFVRDDEATDLRAAEHRTCADLLQAAYPDLAASLPAINTWQGRASLRALPRDSMPLVGEISKMTGVYALTGMGSKGFSFAPLCAEFLASHILAEPLPLTATLRAQINPKRFIKPIRVRKPYYSPPV